MIVLAFYATRDQDRFGGCAVPGIVKSPDHRYPECFAAKPKADHHLEEMTNDNNGVGLAGEDEHLVETALVVFVASAPLSNDKPKLRRGMRHQDMKTV